MATRNNAARLALTLESFRGLEMPPVGSWEIVVVDNGSTDETCRVIAAAAEHLPIRTTFCATPGLSHARNAGVGLARGRLLVFTDDDVTVPPGWLTAYASAYQAHGSSCYFGGPITSDFEGPSLPEELLPYAPNSVKGLDWGDSPRFLLENEWFIGPNWACDASLVASAGGFDPDLGLGQSAGPTVGEETLLMNALKERGVRALYLPATRLRHWVPASKTRARHILHRWENSLAVRTWKAPSPEGKTIFGVPRWHYRELVAAGFKLLVATMRGRRNVHHLVRFHRARGIVRGHRFKVTKGRSGSDGQ